MEEGQRWRLGDLGPGLALLALLRLAQLAQADARFGLAGISHRATCQPNRQVLDESRGQKPFRESCNTEPGPQYPISSRRARWKSAGRETRDGESMETTENAVSAGHWGHDIPSGLFHRQPTNKAEHGAAERRSAGNDRASLIRILSC